MAQRQGSASSDSSFEVVISGEDCAFTNKTPELTECADINPPLKRSASAPLDQNFETFFDPDGRLVEESKFRQSIFNGGINPSIRCQAWQFLFGLYPFSSTSRERATLKAENRVKYCALKRRWKVLMQLQTPPDPSKDELDLLNPDYIKCLENTSTSRDASSPVPSLSVDDLEQRFHFIEIQADVYANRQAFNIEELKTFIRVINKDVPRTDRDIDFFSGDGNMKLLWLRDILVTFTAFHPDIGYTQGMNDILSRFLVVMHNETDAYWCFTYFMENIHMDFLEAGMLRKLRIVRALLGEVNNALLQHLVKYSVDDMVFCHRWLMLSFKREFVFDEALMLFEIISSHHLELSSLEAQKERDRARAKDFQREGGLCRTDIAPMNMDYTFEIFVCAAILDDNSNMLMRCRDAMEVFETANNLVRKMNIHHILERAEYLLRRYCHLSIERSFEVVDVPQHNRRKQNPSALKKFTKWKDIFS